jgi:hypothetical protein
MLERMKNLKGCSVTVDDTRANNVALTYRIR